MDQKKVDESEAFLDLACMVCYQTVAELVEAAKNDQKCVNSSSGVL